MDVDEQAKKIKDWAGRYSEKKGFELNPDEERVDDVAKGLAVRQEKFGKRYCPCRIITGDAEEDRKIICCLLYTSDAADDLTRVDLGGRRIIKKKKKK